MYKMDGQLRECKSRNMLDIAWVLIYADDIALITVSETQMKAAMQVVHHTFEQWGLEVSMKKTKVMSVGHASMAPIQLIEALLSRLMLAALYYFELLALPKNQQQTS